MSTTMLNDVLTRQPFSARGRAASGATFVEDSSSGSVPMPNHDQPYPPGRKVAVKATQAGNVEFTFADGSTDTFPVPVGLTILPFSVIQWNQAGTTATATFSNLL